jgi:hypothetical protein
MNDVNNPEMQRNVALVAFLAQLVAHPGRRDRPALCVNEQLHGGRFIWRFQSCLPPQTGGDQADTTCQALGCRRDGYKNVRMRSSLAIMHLLDCKA